MTSAVVSTLLPWPDVIAFTSVRLPFGWLGNMAPFPIGEWLTSEHLFQALRFPSESPVRQLIRAQKSPMSAKMIAKSHAAEMIVAPRGDQDLANMERVLARKLEQHPILRDRLRLTAGMTIIEDCSRRASASGLFWGAALHDGTWRGENRLGRMWMEIRAKLNA